MDNFDSFVDEVLSGNDRPMPKAKPPAAQPTSGTIRSAWNKLRKQQDWQCPRCKRRVVLPADDTPPLVCVACVKANARRVEIARERAERDRRREEKAARREAFRRKIVFICAAAGIAIISVPVLAVSLIIVSLFFAPNPPAAPVPVTPAVYPQSSAAPAEWRPSEPAAPAYSPPADDDRVHVRGYTRQDGTYVAPHTRSKPTRSK